MLSKYRKFHDVLIRDLRGSKYNRGEFIRHINYDLNSARKIARSALQIYAYCDNLRFLNEANRLF